MTQVFARAATFPDAAALYAALVPIIGASALVTCDFKDDGSKPVRIDKATPWLPAEIAAVQQAVTTAPATTMPLIPLDAFPLVWKAILLTLLDQVNVLRSKLAPPLPAITVAQAIAAVRQKAGEL